MPRQPARWRISRQEPPEEWRWCMARRIRTRHVSLTTEGWGLGAPRVPQAPISSAGAYLGRASLVLRGGRGEGSSAAAGARSVAPPLAARATLTPYSPSLAVKEMPASASASQIARNVAGRTALSLSTRLTTVSASAARLASSTCVQPRRARGTDLPVRRYIHPVHNPQFPVEAR